MKGTNRADYLSRYRQAVDELVKQRWILEEDRPALMHHGEEEWARQPKQMSKIRHSQACNDQTI